LLLFELCDIATVVLTSRFKLLSFCTLIFDKARASEWRKRARRCVGTIDTRFQHLL